MYKFQVQ